MLNDSYGQGVPYPTLFDKPNAQTLGQGIVENLTPRSVMRFPSAAVRGATLSSPVAGMVTYLADVGRLEFYSGTAWLPQSKLLMDWTPLTALGTYASGFSAALPAPRMRKFQEHGAEVWELEGRVEVSSLAPATTKLGFTFGVAHRPSNGRGFMTYNSSHYATRVTWAANGQLTVSVPREAGSAVTNIWLDGVRITNPSA